MKYIIRLKILFFLIFSFCVFYNAKSQDLESVIEFADFQFNSENYNNALREYQRAMFFAGNKEHSYLFRQTASCFFFLADYERAMTYYDFAYNSSKSDSIKLECLFQKTSCLILQKKFNFALIELYSVDISVTEYFQMKKQFFLGVCYYGLERFEESFSSFLNSIREEKNDKKQRLNKLFNNKKVISRPNPKTALVLSIIIPGSGQIYAGDIKNGINSFVLCGGLFLLGVNIATKYGFIDAVLGVLPWYQRYYQGGYNMAEKNAEKKRALNRNIYFQKIIEIISGQTI